MADRTAEEKNQTEDLQSNYRTAFGEWALEVDRLQSANTGDVNTGDVNTCDVKAAEARVEVAESAYRATRDRLAEDYALRPDDEPAA